jgi:hypothetical protein
VTEFLQGNASTDLASHQVGALAVSRSFDRLQDYPDRLCAGPGMIGRRSLDTRSCMLAPLPLAGLRPMYDIPEECLSRVAADEGVSVRIDVAKARSGSVPRNEGA